MNANIKELHETLLGQHVALSEKLGNETNADNARAILVEMEEILHRISIAQGLLFRQNSAALSKSIEKIREADTELTNAIASAGKAADYVKAAGDFLKFVDKTLDLAKTLAV